MMDQTFWGRLKYKIRENNTTQEWVANATDVPFGTLRKWISRKTMPNADQTYAVAKVLNTTVEYLVDGDNGTEYLKRHFSIDSSGSGLLVAEESPPYGQKDILYRDLCKLSDQDREEIKALVSIKLARAQNKIRHA